MFDDVFAGSLINQSALLHNIIWLILLPTAALHCVEIYSSLNAALWNSRTHPVCSEIHYDLITLHASDTWLHTRPHAHTHALCVHGNVRHGIIMTTIIQDNCDHIASPNYFHEFVSGLYTLTVEDNPTHSAPGCRSVCSHVASHHPENNIFSWRSVFMFI